MLEKHYELLLIDAGLGDQMYDITPGDKDEEDQRCRRPPHDALDRCCSCRRRRRPSCRCCCAAACTASTARQPHHAHSLPSPRVAAMGPKHRPFVARTHNHRFIAWECRASGTVTWGGPAARSPILESRAPWGHPLNGGGLHRRLRRRRCFFELDCPPNAQSTHGEQNWAGRWRLRVVGGWRSSFCPI